MAYSGGLVNGGKVEEMAPCVIARPAHGLMITRPVKLTDDEFEVDTSSTVSHAAEPIKRIEDICSVQDYLIKEKRYRDNLLFTCGINFGLRVSDLLTLKVGHLITEDGSTYRDKIVLTEQKTGKRRVVYMNDAVMDAADLYFADITTKEEAISLNDYLFHSLSTKQKGINAPLDRKSVERILKEVINDRCGLDVHASTHCLRKTFAYQVIMNAKDRTRAIEFLQKMFGHSSQAITLRYAGITDEEIRETYQSLNLGNSFYKKWDVCSSSGYASLDSKKIAIG